MKTKSAICLLLMSVQAAIVNAQSIDKQYFSQPAEGEFYLYSLDQDKFYQKSGGNSSQLTEEPQEAVTLVKRDGYEDRQYAIKTAGNTYFKRGEWQNTFFWTDGQETDGDNIKWTIEPVDNDEYYTIASNIDGTDPYHINSSQTTYLNAWKASDDANQKVRFAFISKDNYTAYVKANGQPIPATLNHELAELAGGNDPTTGWNSDHWGYMNNGSSVTYHINNKTAQDYTLSFDAQAKDPGSKVKIEVLNESDNQVLCKDVTFNLWGWNNKCTYRILIPNLAIGTYKLKLTYGVTRGYSANTFDLTLTAGNAATLNLDETSATYTANGYYETANIMRTLKSDKWNTFCIPVDMDIPTDWTVKELTAATYADGKINLTFSNANRIVAGLPYMVKCDADYNGKLTAQNATVQNAGEKKFDGVVTLKGCYTSGNVPQGAYFISDNTFCRAADNSNTLKGFRAYLESLVSAVNPVKSITFFMEDETTDMETILAEEPASQEQKVFDLQGRRVPEGSARKGIFVVNGKKVIF